MTPGKALYGHRNEQSFFRASPGLEYQGGVVFEPEDGGGVVPPPGGVAGPTGPGGWLIPTAGTAGPI